MWSGAIIDSSYAEVDRKRSAAGIKGVVCERGRKTRRSDVATKHLDLADHHCCSQQQHYYIDTST